MKKFKIVLFSIFIITFFLIDFLLKIFNPSPYKVDPILGWSTKKNFNMFIIKPIIMETNTNLNIRRMNTELGIIEQT